ncbi:MAG: U32 family peptidase C-terminal domain-containing protein [Burkholderiales bacterium]|nr:U32 family peptidase C-terminal domain-containing protein [Burkholderiales bacterium]
MDSTRRLGKSDGSIESGASKKNGKETTPSYGLIDSQSVKTSGASEGRGFDETSGMAEVLVKNRFQVGDRLEIIHPSGNQIVELTQMLDTKGKPVFAAPGSGHRVRIPMGKAVSNAFVARFLS